MTFRVRYLGSSVGWCKDISKDLLGGSAEGRVVGTEKYSVHSRVSILLA